MTDDAREVGSYDRVEAARLLAVLAGPQLFPGTGVPDELLGPSRVLSYRQSEMTAHPGSHLTMSQLGYLETYMQPCPPEQVTSATHRLTWLDSDEVPNTGHHGPGTLGAVVPLVARETTLALWRALDADEDLARRITALAPADAAVLAATTTDADPKEILRIGVEATQRCLVQHAYLSGTVGIDDPEVFARHLLAGGVFQTVASTWYWELQASTYRRGMVPVVLAVGQSRELRYTQRTVSLLRAMKEQTLDQARLVMARATGEEGLSVEQAVHKYHDQLDEISSQYALLGPGETPRCLGSMTQDGGAGRHALLPVVAQAFVATFVGMLARVEIRLEQDADVIDLRDDSHVFDVPDMNCAHCKRTITAVLQGRGVTGVEVDLVTKRVVADFRSPAAKHAAMEAVREAGYTVLGPRSE